MDIQEFAQRFHGLVIQPHQKEFIDWLDSVKHRGLGLMPRGHTKTTTVDQIWLSKQICENPEIRVLLISHSKQMAESFSRTIRNIMDNPELQDEFGLTSGTPWKADSWRLEQSPHSKPTLETRGALGRMAGWRGDMVIFDDLLESQLAQTEAMRAKIDYWIKTDVLNAINPEPIDKVIVIGTRKHIDDWYGQLLLNPDYEKFTRTAFLNDEETESLWPYLLDANGNKIKEMWTPEKLKIRREEIGALLFAQEYMNHPSPPEGLLFKYEWLRFYEHLPQHTYINYYMGIDPSHGSTAKKSSWFALCIIAHDKVNNRIYITDMYRNKMSPEEQVQKSIEYANKYRLTAIYVESVFKYTHVYEGMRERFHNVYPIDYIHTQLKGTSVVKKEERIKNICSPPIELGRVYFKEPAKDPYTKMFLEHEYIAFPLGDFDMFDALTLAIHRVAGLRYNSDQPFFFADT